MFSSNLYHWGRKTCLGQARAGGGSVCCLVFLSWTGWWLSSDCGPGQVKKVAWPPISWYPLPGPAAPPHRPRHQQICRENSNSILQDEESLVIISILLIIHWTIVIQIIWSSPAQMWGPSERRVEDVNIPQISGAQTGLSPAHGSPPTQWQGIHLPVTRWSGTDK